MTIHLRELDKSFRRGKRSVAAKWLACLTQSWSIWEKLVSLHSHLMQAVSTWGRKLLSSWRRERGRDYVPPDTALVTVRRERKSSEDANYNIQPDVKCKLIYIGLKICVRNFSGTEFKLHIRYTARRCCEEREANLHTSFHLQLVTSFQLNLTRML